MFRQRFAPRVEADRLGAEFLGGEFIEELLRPPFRTGRRRYVVQPQPGPRHHGGHGWRGRGRIGQCRNEDAAGAGLAGKAAQTLLGRQVDRRVEPVVELLAFWASTEAE